MAIWVKKRHKVASRAWTDDEIARLRAGEPVTTRTETQCRCKAAVLGIVYRSPTSNRWTDEEIEMARRGECPPGRTESAMITYCRGHRIPVPKKPKADFTEEEERLILDDILPEGRSRHMCRKHAMEKFGHSFRPACKKRDDMRMERGKEIVNMRGSGKTFLEIGQAFGVTKQRAAQLYNLYSSKMGVAE